MPDLTPSSSHRLRLIPSTLSYHLMFSSLSSSSESFMLSVQSRWRHSCVLPTTSVSLLYVNWFINGNVFVLFAGEPGGGVRTESHTYDCSSPEPVSHLWSEGQCVSVFVFMYVKEILFSACEGRILCVCVCVSGWCGNNNDNNNNYDHSFWHVVDIYDI